MSFDSPLYPKWYALLNDRCAAWLMAHLHYWQDKATTKRDGRFWIIRTYRELKEEHNCFYSERSIKRAVANLKYGGFIDVILAPHPYRGVLRARWMRLSDECQEKLGMTIIDED